MIRLIASVFLAFLLIIQYAESRSIRFPMQNCRHFKDFRKQLVFSCATQVFIGRNLQNQPINFILSNPLSLPILNTMNFIFNSRCTSLSNCTYAKANADVATTFYQEQRSNSLKIIQTNYTNVILILIIIFHMKHQIIYQKSLPEGYVIKGDLDSEKIYLFAVDPPIDLQFISIYNYTEKLYIGNGVFSLQNGNKNGIFVQGYIQKKFISPMFEFRRENPNTFDINYNLVRDTSYPSIKTYSDNNWVNFLNKLDKQLIQMYLIFLQDVQMVGISLGEENMEAVAHFKTFIVQTYLYSALPKNIAKYLKNKYSQHFDHTFEEYILKYCFQCRCVKDFPDLEIFTTGYKITIPIQEFAFSNTQGQCQINISSQNLLFGVRQILQYRVKFDPLESELQFPRAQLMIHPSITNLEIILIQACILLAMLLVLLIQYERVSLDLKHETNKFYIRKYIQLQNMVKQQIN
ncbi:hypothetical protein ABPG72_006233 [Tetrahymena utriculariae]